MQQELSTANLKHTLPEKQGLSLYEVYATCSEIPLHNWIQITLTNDLNWMIKSGNPDNLQEAYNLLCDEYSTLTKDIQSNYILDISIQLKTLDTRLILVTQVVDFIREHGPRPGLIELLKIDFEFRLSFEDLESDLGMVINLVKSDYMRLKQTEAEYSAFVEKSNENVWTYQDYLEQLSVLSKWQGYALRPKETSLAEYVATLNRFKAENTPKN